MELTNAGLWIFDKTGTPLCTGESTTVPCESLDQFWCSRLGANGQPLDNCSNVNRQESDTQIAYDPFDQRWIATSLSGDSLNHVAQAYLFVAYTTTSSPADFSGNWLRYDTPVCAGNIADEDILGYSNAWIAIDTVCFDHSVTPISDDVTLIPRLDVPGQEFQPVHDSYGPGSVFRWRPSRDISASAYSNLYLAASVVPNGASPYVQYATVVPSSTNISSPASLGAYGDPGSYTLASPACDPAISSCNLNIGTAEVKQVVLQQGNNGNTHFLMTAFSEDASSLNPDRGETLWDILNIESGVVELIELPGNPGEAKGFAGITGDTDQDVYLTSTNINLTTGASPYSVWNYQNNGRLTAQDYLQKSSANYSGRNSCAGTATQNWGDYMSTLWDPSVTSTPSGEKGAFWAVQEFTTDGADQSTQWIELSDPLPYYVSYSANEGECDVNPGANCSVTVKAPANLQNGDVVIAFIDMGGQFPKPPTPPDSTWTPLQIGNLGEVTSMQSGSCAALDLATEYAFAHVYGSSKESGGSYKFYHIDEHYCSGFMPEMEGFLVGYRLANSATSSYLLYGYPAGQSGGTVMVGPAPNNSPSAGTLLNVFWGADIENNESGEYGNTTFTSLTGTPTATVESCPSGQSGCTLPVTPPDTAYLVADVPIPSANSALSQYSINSSISNFHTFGWQLFLPEP